MTWYMTVAVWLVKAYRRANGRKWGFFGISALIFFSNIALLRAYDLLPEASASPALATSFIESTAAVSNSIPEVPVIEEPISMEIPVLKMEAVVVNPTSTDVKILDNELLKGAVRYPTSAKLGEIGNVVLFGHSSYLPVVGNPVYKTFNGIQKLVPGDVVMVYSSGRAYTYRVRSMEKKSADDDGIDLAVEGNVLTLSTCDSFGKKSDRFVVTADLVESHLLSTS